MGEGMGQNMSEGLHARRPWSMIIKAELPRRGAMPLPKRKIAVKWKAVGWFDAYSFLVLRRRSRRAAAPQSNSTARVGSGITATAMMVPPT
jgi:hypothetical protein